MITYFKQFKIKLFKKLDIQRIGMINHIMDYPIIYGMAKK